MSDNGEGVMIEQVDPQVQEMVDVANRIGASNLGCCTCVNGWVSSPPGVESQLVAEESVGESTLSGSWIPCLKCSVAVIEDVLPPRQPMLNGDSAYFWQVENGQALLYRGIVIEEADGVVHIQSSREIKLPVAEVYPTYVEAVEAGAAKGYKLQERTGPVPKPIDVWVCSGCKAVEKLGPLDQRVQLNAAITFRRQKCRKCGDEMLLETRVVVQNERRASAGAAV